MYNATLIHIETGIEYYKDDNIYTPSQNEKLLFSLFGLPENVKKFEQKFETVIDEFTCFTKKEIEAKVNENFKKGLYNYLPAMCLNQDVVLVYGK